MSKMYDQRQTLLSASENAKLVTSISSRAHVILENLREKNRVKRRRLQFVIAVLVIVDSFLLYRLVVCGSFVYCH